MEPQQAKVTPRSHRVRSWMNRGVPTIRGDAPIAAAAELIRARHARHLPVVDPRGRLIGIVTDRDLRHMVFDPTLRRDAGWPTMLNRTPVAEIMTRAVVTVPANTDLDTAARLMHERRIGALPVVEGDRLVGILTEDRLLAAFQAILGRRPVPARRGPVRIQGRHAPAYDFGFPLPPAWNGAVDDGIGD